MRFYHILLLFIFLTAAQTAAAQRGAPRGAVSGTVTEEATGEPVQSASVGLWNAADSSLVTGAITLADGTFRIEPVRPGAYYLRVSFIGYEPHTVSDVTFEPGNPEVNVGRIALLEGTTSLDEVQVSGEREYMEVGIDRTVYNTREMPVTAGGSAKNVLENIPSIEVDIDDNISLRGNQNVAIHLNGRPAPMSGDALTSFLEGLAADDIQRVEVIPNPSARYDPEGMSGIINIVLAENRDIGWGGGVSASAGTRGNYNASANAHYGSGPWNAYANYGLRYGQRERSGSRWQENRFLDPLTYMEQDLSSVGGGLSNTLNATVDYQLSKRNTLSLTGILSHRGRNSDVLNTYSELDMNRDITRRYNRLSDNDRNDFGMDYRLDFTRVIKPREHELSVEARYEEDRESGFDQYAQRLLSLDNSDAEGELLDRQQVDEDEHERSVSAQVDYQRPLGSIASMEAGYKGEAEWLDSRLYSESLNDEGVLASDPDLNNTFNYGEQIHAGYGILAGELGNFGAQLGLRLEQALVTFDQRTMGETYHNDYFSFFPSAHVSYQPLQGNTFKLSYSKRVRRPNTWQLNPFGDYDDPTFIRVGNPYLNPEYTHSYEVSYSRMGQRYTVSLSPYYRHTVDAISWHEDMNADGVTVLTFENFTTESSYGTELIGSLTLGDWLKGNASLNAYKQVTDGSNLSSELSSDAIGFRTRLSATATLREGLNLQVSQFYRSPMDIPGGRIASFTRTDIALQQKLLGGRATLNLRASDVFDTMSFHVQREMARYYQEYTREPQSRGLQLSLRYTFGQQDRNRRGQDRGGDYEGGEGGMEGGGMGM